MIDLPSKQEKGGSETSLSSVELILFKNKLFDLIVTEVEKLNPEEKKAVLLRVLTYSSDDGLVLAQRMGLDTEEKISLLTDPSFVSLHREFLWEIRRLLSYYYGFLNREDFDEADRIIKLGPVLNDDKKFSKYVDVEEAEVEQSPQVKSVLSKIDDLYLKFVENPTSRKVEEIEKKSESDILFDAFMRQQEFATSEFYYPGEVIKLITRSLGVPEETLEEELLKKSIKVEDINILLSSQFFDKKFLSKILKKLKLNIDDFEKTRKKPLDILYYNTRDGALKATEEELQRVANIMHGVGKVEVVREEGKILLRKKDEDRLKIELEREEFENEKEKHLRDVVERSLVEKDFSTSFDYCLEIKDEKLCQRVLDSYVESQKNIDLNGGFVFTIQEKIYKLNNLFPQIVKTHKESLYALKYEDKEEKETYRKNLCLSIVFQDDEEFAKILENPELLRYSNYQSKIIELIKHSKKSKYYTKLLINYLRTDNTSIHLNTEFTSIIEEHEPEFILETIQKHANGEAEYFFYSNEILERLSETKKEDFNNAVLIFRVAKNDEDFISLIASLKNKTLEDNFDFLMKLIEKVDLENLKDSELKSLLSKFTDQNSKYLSIAKRIVEVLSSKGEDVSCLQYYGSIEKNWDTVNDILQKTLLEWKQNSITEGLYSEKLFKDNHIVLSTEEKSSKESLSKGVYESKHILSLVKGAKDVPNNVIKTLEEITIFLCHNQGTDEAIALALALDNKDLQRYILENSLFTNRSWNREYSMVFEIRLAASLKDYSRLTKTLKSISGSEITNSFEYLYNHGIMRENFIDEKIVEIIIEFLLENNYRNVIPYFLEDGNSKKELLVTSHHLYEKTYKILIERGLLKNLKYDFDDSLASVVLIFAYKFDDIRTLKKLFAFFKDDPQYKYQTKRCLKYIEEIENVQSKEADIKTSDMEQKLIDRYQIISHPKPEDVQKWKEEEKKDNTFTESLKSRLLTLIKTRPKLFAGKIKSKRDNLNPQKIKQIIFSIFPNVTVNKERYEQENRSSSLGGLFSQIFGENYAFNELNRGGYPSKNSFLSNEKNSNLWGGDPRLAEAELSKIKVMESSKPVSAFQITNVYLGSSQRDASWREVPISVENSVNIDEAISITIDDLYGFHGQLTLPRPNNSAVNVDSIKAYNRSGEIFEIKKATKMPDGQITLDIEKGVYIDKIIYEYVPGSVEVDTEISLEDFEGFTDTLLKEAGSQKDDLLETKVELPTEVELFLESIKSLSPYEKVKEIEKYVKEISYYDFDNGEIAKEKYGRSPDVLIAIMQMRLEEIRAKKPELVEGLSGKLFTGVCSDFANLTATICRKAGISAGVSVGFLQEGKIVTLADAHGVCTIPWKSKTGGTTFLQIDTTPAGLTPEENERLKRFRLPESNVDLLDFQSAQEESLRQKEKRLDEIIADIDSGDFSRFDKVSKAELKELMDVIFSKKLTIKEIFMLESLFSSVKYSPNNELIFSDEIDDKVKMIKFIEGELKRERKSGQSDRITFDDSKPSVYLLKMINEYADAYSNENRVFNKRASFEVLDKIIDMAGNNLTNFEKKVYKIASAYLKLR